jgi:hypothetical protein
MGNPTPRSNPFEYQVRTAEPRATSYGRPTMPTANVYPYATGVPRSHEDLYEEPLRHTPKKSSSYDSSDRRREKEDRRDDEERTRQREKDSKRATYSKKEKSRDKDRKRGTEEKVRSRVYVEDDTDDEFRSPPFRSSDKKSRYKIDEENRMREEEARAARERVRATEIVRPKEIPLQEKWNKHKDRAAEYMQAARRKVVPEDDYVHPGMRRAETFNSTTPAYNVRYATPTQYSDDDLPRRSSARPKETRRASDTPRKDKSSRRSPAIDPYIVTPPSPPPTRKPNLHTYSSAPPTSPATTFTREKPSRSKTQDYPRHETTPPLPRAATFQAGDRGRGGGSRLKQEVTSDSESDSPIYPSPRRSHSPPPRSTQTRYVYQDGAAVPVPPSRHRSDHEHSYPRDRSESPRGTPSRPTLSRNPGSGDHSRGIPTRSHSYYTATPVPPEPVIHTVRPKMSPRTDSYRSSNRTVPQFFGEVKYSQGFDNISYTPNPTNMYPSHRRASDARDYYPHQRGSGREIYT